MGKQLFLLLFLIILIIFVIVFSCFGINASDSSGINIQDLIVTQLHETYEDLPHKYNLTLIVTGIENINISWAIDCGYFVGGNKGSSVEWHYDTAGECVNAKVEVNATNATGAGQKLNQDIFNSGTRIITNIYLGNISERNASDQTTPPKNDTIILLTSDYIPGVEPGDIISVRYTQENPSTIKTSSLPTFPIDFERLDEIKIENDIPGPVIIGVKKISDSVIEFQNLADTAGLNYSWDFGDGATSDEQNPAHKYEKPGDYIINLNVIDSNGNTATQKLPITIKKIGFFRRIFGGFFGIFGFGKEKIKEIRNDVGSVVTLSSTVPIKIYNTGGYAWGTTNSDIAIVDSNGVVRFTENFTQGKLVGILGIKDNEQLITFIRYVDKLEKSQQFVVIGDPIQNLKGNLNVIVLNTTKETFDTDLALAASDVSDEADETAQEFLEGSAKDIFTELVRLRSEKWAKLYELTRKIWEGKKSFEKIPESACKCLELFQEFLGSKEEIDTKNNFWNYCFCIHTMADSAGVTFFGYYSCWGISDYAPDPNELKEQNFEVYKKMIESLEDSIKECREPGYLEKRAKECEEAKKNCEKAKELTEKAKKLVSETKQLVDEVKNASQEAELSAQRANIAFEKIANANASESIRLANEIIKEARSAEGLAFYANKTAQEARDKKKEAKNLLDLALILCPGKCAPKDNSTEIIDMINKEKVKLKELLEYDYTVNYIFMIAIETGAKAEIAVEKVIQKQELEEKNNCENALSLAREALGILEMIWSWVDDIKRQEQKLAESEKKLKELELKAMHIRVEERYSRSISLRATTWKAAFELDDAENYFDEIKVLQHSIDYVANLAKEIAAESQKALSEGSSKDKNCIEAKKLIPQIIEKADETINSASSAFISAEKSINSARKTKQKIEEIEDEWEDKRETFNVYTYVNDNGETVIWAGNGDAQPPKGSVYHGTMQNGKWIDGGPPLS